ncbi:CpsD/CapB family tyrosine-protein kinase [Desulfatirhabdium butyrativorans]|uniref:CpsD/CapB family tyrosine-protein kinase n=1 Tax=Desulfatirhabdium butyrativorans TaxID=340467 RepID=UPI000419AC81|nr:CpsD/CapB family tyrosine-protein kinase [Desulfatirhabdium butyrativorans]
MSATQPKTKNEEITERDLFGSIPKALDINPFEGINFDEIAVKPVRKESQEEDELIEINPIKGVDLDEISALPFRSSEPEDYLEIVEINPIEEEHLEGLNDIHPPTASKGPVEAALPRAEAAEGFSQKLKRFFFRKSEAASESRPDTAAHHPKAKASPPSEAAAAKPAVVAIQPPKPFKPKTSFLSRLLPRPMGNGARPPLSAQLIKQAFNYAEIYRIREKILTTLDNQPHKAIMVASPYDNTGNTFMVSVLGMNAAAYTQLNLLLLDLNMRSPQLHVAFGRPLANGFGEIAQGAVHWSDTVKETELPNLKLITAGSPVRDMARFLNKEFLESLLMEVKNEFDMVLLDTSPVMVRNRNNVDPILLGRMSDLVLVMTRNKHTSRSALMNTVQAIAQDGGNIVGIVYNQ